ncbi:MAG: NAD-dependent epimerase/dehydratase family protein [Planctomycetota bacterium]
MRVLLTGGHGFVGSHLVDALLARGDRVRCLHRRRTRPESLVGKEVEVAHGDVRDAGAVARAIEGVDEVYHLAALTRSRTRAEMWATNVTATRVLLEAGARAGLPGRFVFCSSLAAVGPSPGGEDLTEEAPCRPVTWYGESKAQAEAEVLRFRDRLAVTVIRPPAVYGPRDRDFLALFRSAARGFLPILGGGGRTCHLVYAADLAEAFVRAARAPATIGRTYFAAHPERVTDEVLLDCIERAVGRRGRRVRIPLSTLCLIAAVGEIGAQASARAPLLNRQRLRDLIPRWWVCDARALRRDTGWTASTALSEGTARAAAWYREHGWIPRSRSGSR